MLPASPRELASERARASLYRRLHNDAVATALLLRRRYTVRILRLAGRSAEPRPFEMADGSICTLTAGPPDSPPSSLAYVCLPATQPTELLQSAKRANVIVHAVRLHSDGWPAGFASFVARVHAPATQPSRELLQSAKLANRHSACGRELGWPCE